MEAPRGRETQESAHADSWIILCRYMMIHVPYTTRIHPHKLRMHVNAEKVPDRARWFSHHVTRPPMIHNLRHEQALAKKIEHPL